MSDPKVQAMAKVFLEDGSIAKMIETTLKAMGVDLKKDPKAYYKGSRQVFKALMAVAAQRMLDEGANTRLLQDTYNPLDAWELYLTRHPDVAAKLQPKLPTKPKPKLELIEGGKEEEPLMLECASGCHGIFTSVEDWQNHKCNENSEESDINEEKKDEVP